MPHCWKSHGLAHILNRQYESIMANNNNIPTPEGTPFSAMSDIKFTTEGVLKLPQKLNRNKATGPRMLQVRFLKELATEISLFLTTNLTEEFGHWNCSLQCDCILQEGRTVQCQQLQACLQYVLLLQDPETYHNKQCSETSRQVPAPHRQLT